MLAFIELPPQANHLVQLGVGGGVLIAVLYILTPLMRDIARKGQTVPAQVPVQNGMLSRSVDDFRRDVSAVVHTVVADRNKTDIIPILQSQTQILRDVAETNKAIHLLLAQLAAKEI